jgi:hypothetical protein
MAGLSSDGDALKDCGRDDDAFGAVAVRVGLGPGYDASACMAPVVAANGAVSDGDAWEGIEDDAAKGAASDEEARDGIESDAARGVPADEGAWDGVEGSAPRGMESGGTDVLMTAHLGLADGSRRPQDAHVPRRERPRPG